ncbi:hypothetical protein SDC9_122176 [bioreactor metagenome]|uniref:Uncharacterized protein n=1 Tax=bioreactor metagenome TaxID=1076179 RepID=A0A645CE59_9ZZZZ
MFKHLQHRAAARRPHLSLHHIGLGDGVHGHKSRQPRIGTLARGRQAGQRNGCNLQAGDALTLLPEPWIADQHQVRLLGGLRHGEQACNQFGADATRIAQGQGDNGKRSLSHAQSSLMLFLRMMSPKRLYSAR